MVNDTMTNDRMTNGGVARARRGTAMIEFIMGIPLLATIIGLTFFFGWGMKNTQRVAMASRYVTWRHVEGGAGGGSLNAMFFENQATSSDVDWPAGRRSHSGQVGMTQAVLRLRAEVGDGGGRDIADWLLADQAPTNVDYLYGCRSNLRAEFSTTVDAWRRMAGRIAASGAREGNEWRRRQASCEEAFLQEPFLLTLDGKLLALHERLTAMSGSDNTIGSQVRELYLRAW